MRIEAICASHPCVIVDEKNDSVAPCALPSVLERDREAKWASTCLSGLGEETVDPRRNERARGTQPRLMKKHAACRWF